MTINVQVRKDAKVRITVPDESVLRLLRERVSGEDVNVTLYPGSDVEVIVAAGGKVEDAVDADPE